MSTILAGGDTFAVKDYLNDPIPAQNALGRARKAFGHALCQCKAPARQLVIRDVRNVLYLAVWPNDGHMHDALCGFYREKPDQEANSEDEAKLIPGPRSLPAVKLEPSGHWDVNLDVPRLVANMGSSEQHERTGHTGPQNRSPNQAQKREVIPLTKFHYWLWDSTSMSRWGKGWKRDWWSVARAIRTEAQAVHIQGRILNDLLYIPPPFRKDREREIHAEWNEFLQPLQATAEVGGRPYGFVLGELKSVEPTKFGFRLNFRNMAKPVFINELMHGQLAKIAPLGLALLPRSSALQCSVVALLMVEASGKSNIRAIAGSLLLCNKVYTPVNTIHELQLANLLCDEGRVFTRGIGKHQGADFVLRDTTPPTAMIISSLLSLDYRRSRDLVIERCQQAGCTIWLWEASTAQPMPVLPLVAPLVDRSVT